MFIMTKKKKRWKRWKSDWKFDRQNLISWFSWLGLTFEGYYSIRSILRYFILCGSLLHITTTHLSLARWPYRINVSTASQNILHALYKYVSVWINFTKLSRRINFGFCSLPSLAFFMHSFGSFFSLTFGITSFILNLIHEKMCIIVSNMIHGFYVTKNKPQKIESVTISITRNVTECNNWLCQLTK